MSDPQKLRWSDFIFVSSIPVGCFAANTYMLYFSGYELDTPIKQFLVGLVSLAGGLGAFFLFLAGRTLVRSLRHKS